jgi:hypothetical protein
VTTEITARATTDTGRATVVAILGGGDPGGGDPGGGDPGGGDPGDPGDPALSAVSSDMLLCPGADDLQPLCPEVSLP